MKFWKRAVIAFFCALITLIVIMEVGNWFVTTNFPNRHEKDTIMALQIGINAFRSEYNDWPIKSLNFTDDKPLRSEGELITVLLGKSDILNPRKIKFFDPVEAKDRKRGLIEANGSYQLVDTWGESYYLIFDKNNDATPNPDPAAAEEVKSLNAPVIFYSSGPDKDPTTWNDNVTSW